MWKKKAVALGLVSLLVVGMVGCGNSTGTSSSSGSAKKGKFVIGFSNSYNGNTYRQEEETFFKQVGDQLKKSGDISDYTIVESNNNTSQQISQIENLILKGVNAIVIDPGSASALDGAIAKATAAHIPCIVVNDGPVTSKDAYQINFDLKEVTSTEAQYVADRLNGKGNVVVMRGLAGTESDKELYQGFVDVFSKYPNIKVVGTIYANWTNTVAQSELSQILPSLPKVDAVVGEGGDAYGAVQAFKAAGRDIPLITGGNRGYFLNWWGQEAKANGYQTVSVATNPWCGAAGLYVAVDILNGKKVPKVMKMDPFKITQDDLTKYENVDPTAVASPTYDWNWVKSNLENQ